jgi:hypothetical protein
VVQNGLGYDDFMAKIEQDGASSTRKIITVQTLLGLPDSTPNPHRLYQPTTIPGVAAVETDLETLDPARARRPLQSQPHCLRQLPRPVEHGGGSAQGEVRQ